MSKKAKHPMQPIVDVQGIHRFKENKIVSYLLECAPTDLYELATLPFSKEDREQLAQLIGYSVCGFCDLSYCSEKSKDKAWAKSEKIARKNNKQNNKQLRRD